MLILLNKKICFLLLLATSTLTAENQTPSKDITITAKPLTKSAIKALKLVNNYSTRRFQALEITIENKTAHEYVLAQENIDLKLEDTTHSSRYAKAVRLGGKIKRSPIIIPIAAGVAITALLISGLGLATLPSVIAGATIGVTALNLNMHGTPTPSPSKIHPRVLDFYHPTLVQSYSKTQKIIFIASKNLPHKLSIALESLDSLQKINFDVKLN